MSKRNPVRPKLNTEYTFIFPNGKLYTLKYYGEDENGKYIFYNVKTKLFAKPCTPRHFDYMYERQLRNERYIGPTRVDTFIKKDNPQPEDNIDERRLNRINALSTDEKQKFKEYFGKTVEAFLSEYKGAIERSDVTELTNIRYACMLASCEGVI